jgi:hypothetical protein
MGQQMGKQGTEQVESLPGGTWLFTVDFTTTAFFDKKHYRVITGGAQLYLQLQAGDGYVGYMQFTVPVMYGQPGATPAQILWATSGFELGGVTLVDGILTFSVPPAVPAFLNNFDGISGAPIPPAPAGPTTGTFNFQGAWDGTSQIITDGLAWVPPGWLLDAGGVMHQGQPPGSGDGSANATWVAHGHDS